MIVREIKVRPELLDTFDWFNDYDDTRRWAFQCCPELVDRLDAGHDLWLKNRNRPFYGGKLTENLIQSQSMELFNRVSRTLARVAALPGVRIEWVGDSPMIHCPRYLQPVVQSMLLEDDFEAFDPGI